MNLTISGHHLEVTPALRSYVTGKLDRISRHFDQVVDVKVLLTVEKQKEKEKRQRAECNVHVKGNDLFAEFALRPLRCGGRTGGQARPAGRAPQGPPAGPPLRHQAGTAGVTANPK